MTYAQYRDSGIPWIGRVPAHWAVSTVAQLGHVQGGKALAVRAPGAQQPYLRVANVFDGRIDTADVASMPFTDAEFARYQLHPDDILLNEGQSLELVGRAARYVGTPSPCAFQNSLIRVQVNPNGDPGYIERLFRYCQASGIFSMIATQTTSIAHLGVSRLARLQLCTPPHAEQIAIARFLEERERDIEHYLATKRRMIEVLEEQRQRRVDAVVLPVLISEVHGADALNTAELEGNLPPGWTLRPLHQVTKIQSGITLGADYKGRPLVELPYLRVANVQAGGIDLSELKTVSIPELEAQSSLLRAGDVLMTEGGDLDKLGRGTVWEGQVQPCLHQNHVFAVRPDHRVLSSEWLSAMLATRYARQYFYLTGKKTTNLASTNRWQIGRFKVPIPPINEQARLLSTAAASVAPIDEGIALFRSEIAVMEEYRTRLIADAVTGQIDVRRHS